MGLLKLFGYNGNQNLKKVGIPVEFEADQLEEYIKCKKDPVYFIDNYCYIVSLDHGTVKFKLFEYQKRFIRSIHENNRVVSMQPRQQGKSQVVAAYVLWYTLFNPTKTVAILANKAAAAREIMSRYQFMYEGLPIWLQQGIKEWNKGSIELENGSKVFTAATTSSGIRGKSVNFLYVDETAIIPNTVAEEFFASVYPTISSGTSTKVVLTSTPLGYNHFWKFWTEAEQGINGFVPVKVEYWEHPNRDEAWAKKQREILGDLRFNQEVLCSFLGSSATLLSSEAINRLAMENPVYTNNLFDAIERPKVDHIYVLVADTSKGVGGDYSAFVVIDITTMPYKVVAKYRDNRISPLLYPNVIHKVAKEYNNAYVLVEINSSEEVANILHDEFEYENLLSVSKGKQGQEIGGGFKTGSKHGVTTDKKVKRIGCSNLKSLIEGQQLLVTDKDIISEFSTFIEDGKGSFSADDGYHDDLVMPLVLFGWLSDDRYFKDMMNVNIRSVLYEREMKQIEDELTPFGFLVNGSEEYDNEDYHGNF